MASVRFTVTVAAAAVHAAPAVWAGLDQDGDDQVESMEIVPLAGGEGGVYAGDLPGPAGATAGLDYIVMVQAPQGSTYAVVITRDGKTLASPKTASVGLSGYAATTGVLA